MKQAEKEKVYLLNRLPADLNKCESMIIRAGNFYNPNTVDSLRIRQKGNQYELTKKEGNSTHRRTEHTIKINKEEFDILWSVAKGKYEKIRYLYPLGKNIAEIDMYRGKLGGYTRVEVEFKDKKEMEKFTPPDWFGPEITQWNHEIHQNISKISFPDLKKRYNSKGIELKPIKLPK